MLGASHRHTEVADLARLSAAMESLHLTLRSSVAVRGFVTLLTCNRAEAYLDLAVPDDQATIDTICVWWAKRSGFSRSAFDNMVVTRTGQEAQQHLFAVCSALDSVVVGESEIAGQVRTAIATARANRTMTPLLELTFQSALHTAKRVNAAVSLGKAGRSIVTSALDLTDLDLTQQPSLIVGTGSYARVSAAALRRRGATSLRVYSPSGRGKQFARAHAASVVKKGSLARAIAGSAVVVTCSGGKLPALNAGVVSRALGLRRSSQPLTVVDLALHADVEPQAQRLPGLVYIGLDALGTSPGPERQQIVLAWDLVNAGVAALGEELRRREAAPAICILRHSVKSAVRDRLTCSLAGSGVPAARMDRFIHQFSQHILHEPTLQLREAALRGNLEHVTRQIFAEFGVSARNPRETAEASAERQSSVA